MRPSEYASLDGTALAALLRAGEVTAEEVRRAARSCIVRVDTELNATVGGVLADPPAHDPGGPFAGVPFAVKDLVCHAEGLPQQSGSLLCADTVADHDTHLMRRWRAAGLVTLCRTTTPEFGLSCSTESRATGITRNPFRLDATPGGSSGGSAALVAAGALPWAHANDAAGSIRIPAALCGLVGLKPTRGRIPSGPDADDPLFGLSAEFALTRTVRDSAALLDAVAGWEPGERYQLPAPGLPYSRAVRRDPPRLRIAFTSTPPLTARVDTAHRRAVEETAAVLEALGHEVTETPLALDPDEFVENSARLWSASVADTVGGFARDRSTYETDRLLEPVTRVFAAQGRTQRWSDVSAARGWQNRLTRAVARQFRSFDLHLTPTVARTAWPVGLLGLDQHVERPAQWLARLFEFVPFTPLHNVTGQPAISVPAGFDDGLPVGVQLAAHPGREDLLLSVAAQLERAAGAPAPRPTVHAAPPAASPQEGS
ncbi:amidase [Streptomyces sp. SID8352]|uniref:amidase n=1 Tax=Streptomyces sp. SID8352 TaxID=2690338 RepID=UPI00136DE38A|nr:amidase [Streptomyces sp. SID8352]MYU22605.1 amidase [Streptomyces sp. SID8352]